MYVKDGSKNKVQASERKLLRKIYGPINDNRTWRIRYNHELYQINRETPISQYIKVVRLRWVGHVVRMPHTRLTKRALNSKMHGRRSRPSRPLQRWEDEVAGRRQTMEKRGYGRPKIGDGD